MSGDVICLSSDKHIVGLINMAVNVLLKLRYGEDLAYIVRCISLCQLSVQIVEEWC